MHSERTFKVISWIDSKGMNTCISLNERWLDKSKRIQGHQDLPPFVTTRSHHFIHDYDEILKPWPRYRTTAGPWPFPQTSGSIQRHSSAQPSNSKSPQAPSSALKHQPHFRNLGSKLLQQLDNAFWRAHLALHCCAASKPTFEGVFFFPEPRA